MFNRKKHLKNDKIGTTYIKNVNAYFAGFLKDISHHLSK